MTNHAYPCHRCGGPVEKTRPTLLCVHCSSMETVCGGVIGDTVRNILLDAPGATVEGRLRVLRSTAEAMEAQADKLRLEALVLQHGPETIARARAIQDDALEAVIDAELDDPRDFIVDGVHEWAEWAKLEAAIQQLEIEAEEESDDE